MKRMIFLLLTAFTLLFYACASKKTLAGSPAADGSSFGKAIVIDETQERPGIGDEYAWIKQHYPGAQNNGQALVYHEKKPYDVLHITTADGKTMAIYFDISKFYGKW
jgi:hypothetical protein